LKKVKKDWSHELKHANITTKMNVAKVRAELIHHSHSRHKHICYTTMTVPVMWQTQHFIRPVFVGHRLKRFSNDRKKLGHFSQNV